MQALGILGDCTDSRRFRKIYEELRRKMEKGTLASSAMEQTGVFPEMAVNMIVQGKREGPCGNGRKAGGPLPEGAPDAAPIQGALLYPKFLGSCR